MADIALTASMRSNLLSLSSTQDLMDITQERLSSGYSVNSAMDNPSSYFTAQSLTSRASDLSTLLDSIGQAISTLEVADEGITTLQDFVEQAKSVANSARDTANVSSKVTTDAVEFNSSTAKEDLMVDLVKNIKDGDAFTIRMGDSTKMEGTANVSMDQTLSEIGVESNSIEMIVGDQTYNFKFAAGATPDPADTATDANGVISQTIGLDSTLEDFMADVVYTVGRDVLNAEVVDGKLSFSTMDNSSLVIRSAVGDTVAEDGDDTTITFNQAFGFDEGQKVEFKDTMTVEQFRQAIDDLEGISADINSDGNLVITGDQGDDMVIADVIDITTPDDSSNLVKSLFGDNVLPVTNGSNERATYAQQFDGILSQVDELVQDTSYKGINLLKGDDLEVVFNESRTSTLKIEGVKFDSTGLGLNAASNEWIGNADIDDALDQITKATSMLRAQASEFGQNLSTVQIREDFTETMINNLTTGSDKLTLADMNEEAANMLALQTRQQLGTNSLSMASQSAQSVLKLF